MKLLLIDLSSIAHPLWHISASDPDPNATSTKIVARVRALSSGQPHVAICTEGGRSFRKDLDLTYKANRPESDAALQHQIALAIDILKTDGFPVWCAKGYEADDIIGTATHVATTPIGNEQLPIFDSVTIASADKDLLQCVSSRVSVHSLTSGNDVDEDAVRLKLGIEPTQVVDYLALVGDASDNIKGAKGVGPKKAAELLSKYGTLEDLYVALTEHGTEFTPSLATNLREFQPRMALVRKLVRLKTDAPIPFEEIFKERVPTDVAVFGDEEANTDEGRKADIEDAMPTLMDAQEAGEAASLYPPHEVPAFSLRTRPSTDAGLLPVAPAGANQGHSLDSRISGLPPAPKGNGSVITTLAVRDSAPPPAEWERQLEPRSMTECKQLAADLFASRLFSAYGNPPAVLSTILAGRELGLQAMASLRAFHIIDGKPSLAADLIRALVLRSGAVEYFRPTERTADRCTFAIKRKGEPEVVLTYTLDEAKTAWAKDEKAWKSSGWGRNPADMLVARASAKLARLVCPDVTHGLCANEEME